MGSKVGNYRLLIINMIWNFIIFICVYSSGNSTNVEKPEYLDLIEYEITDDIKAWYVAALVVLTACCCTCYICGETEDSRANFLKGIRGTRDVASFDEEDQQNAQAESPLGHTPSLGPVKTPPNSNRLSENPLRVSKPGKEK